MPGMHVHSRSKGDDGTVPLLSFPAARYTLRDRGFYCFGVRDALASAEKTEHVKGELFFLPFILFTLDSCCSGKVLGEISINTFHLFLALRNEKLAFCGFHLSNDKRVFNFLAYLWLC